MSQALPTRKAEDWRYADLPALATLWPLPAPEAITVAAGGTYTRAIVQDAGGVQQLTLTLEPKATAEIHILNMGGAYGRVELAVTLHEGADFTLGAAQLGAGDETLEIITTVTHAGPNATSRQLVRSVLAGHATGTYLGKVAVARGANGTDASQSVRAMLLDRSVFNQVQRTAVGGGGAAITELKSQGSGSQRGGSQRDDASVAGSAK